MRKLVLFLFCATSSFATPSLFIGGSETANTTATQYLFIQGTNTASLSGSENTKYHVFSTTGSLVDLRVKLNNAPGSGKSYTYTVRKNSAATELSCVVSGTNTTCVSTGTYLTVGSTDYVTFQAVGAGTPARSTPTYTTIFLSSQTGVSQLANQGTPNTSSTFYMGVNGANAAAQTTESNAWGMISSSGTAQYLVVYSTSPPGAGKSYAFTLRKNGADTAITCTNSGASQKICTDNSNTVRFMPGDRISLKGVPSGTPANVQTSWAIAFTADHKGEFNITSGRATGFSTSATQYTAAMAGNTVPATSESTRYGLTQNTTAQLRIDAMYVYLSAAPGAAKSYTLNLRQNGGAPSSQATVAISGASQQYGYDDTHLLIPQNNDYLGIESVPSGTPTSSTAAIGLRGFVTQRKFIIEDL